AEHAALTRRGTPRFQHGLRAWRAPRNGLGLGRRLQARRCLVPQYERAAGLSVASGRRPGETRYGFRRTLALCEPYYRRLVCLARLRAVLEPFDSRVPAGVCRRHRASERFGRKENRGLAGLAGPYARTCQRLR